MTEWLAGSGWALTLPLVALVGLWFLPRLARRPERGLYLVFFSTGILLSPELPIVREKLTAVEAIMLLTWLALLFHSGRRTQKPAPLTKAQKQSLALGGAFTIWVILSFFLNNLVFPDQLVASAVETLNFVYGYLMFATVVFMARDWETWRGCLHGWLWGAVVVCFFGVWAVLGGAPAWTYDEFSGRVSSTLRLGNQLPSFLLPLFVALVFMVVRRRQPLWHRWALLALLAAMFLTAIGTGSRTAFLMLIVAALGVVYVAVREAPRRAFNPSLLTTVALGVFAGLGAYILLALAGYEGDYALGRTPAWQRPVVVLFDWSEGVRELDPTRPEQLRIVWENFGNHPIIGTGPKMYGDRYGVEEIHNTYAGVLIQTGVVGLFLFLCWLGHTLWLGQRASRRIVAPDQRVLVLSMVIGMGLLLLYSMTIFGLRQRNLWLLAGLLVAAIGLAPRAARPSLAVRYPGSAPAAAPEISST